MGAKKETIYIKAERHVEVTKRHVDLGDVISVTCGNREMMNRIKTTRLFHFSEKGFCDDRQAVSILKVIACIQESYPNAEIQNLGEQDFLVSYRKPGEGERFLTFLKVGFVMLVCFFGAAFSMMAFNNDVDVPRLFSQIYFWVTGKTSSGFTVLEASYSLGIMIGITLFFNHFGRIRFSRDPTPIEVEMRVYEKEIQDTLIENASRKGREIDADG